MEEELFEEAVVTLRICCGYVDLVECYVLRDSLLGAVVPQVPILTIEIKPNLVESYIGRWNYLLPDTLVDLIE